MKCFFEVVLTHGIALPKNPERRLHALQPLAGCDSFASPLLSVCDAVYSSGMMGGVLDLLKRLRFVLPISTVFCAIESPCL